MTKRRPPDEKFVDHWEGRGGMLHRIRIAQKKSAQNEKVHKTGSGYSRRRPSPSLPRMPWDNPDEPT